MSDTGDNDTESTDELIEGTRQAREAATEALQEAHEDAEELEERLEAEGLVPDDEG